MVCLGVISGTVRGVFCHNRAYTGCSPRGPPQISATPGECPQSTFSGMKVLEKVVPYKTFVKTPKPKIQGFLTLELGGHFLGFLRQAGTPEFLIFVDFL